jgi:hypothetical protein
MSWSRLKELRARGLRPRLPTWITTNPKRKWHLLDTGFLVVDHAPGSEFDAKLLAGLDVILDMGCDRAALVVRALRAHSVRPSSIQSWCNCMNQLVTPGWTCAQMTHNARPWERKDAEKATPDLDTGTGRTCFVVRG